MHCVFAMLSQLKNDQKANPCAPEGLFNEKIPVGRSSQWIQKTIASSLARLTHTSLNVLQTYMLRYLFGCINFRTTSIIFRTGLSKQVKPSNKRISKTSMAGFV